MNRQTLAELIEAIAGLDPAEADVPAIELALADCERLRRWLAARRLVLHRRLQGIAAWPEHTAAKAAGEDLKEAEKTSEQAALAEEAPAFAAALADGHIAPEHLAALLRCTKELPGPLRSELLSHQQRLVALAAGRTPAQFAKRLKLELEHLRRGESEGDRLERQRRSIRFRTWIDPVTGMYRFTGELDPLTGLLVDGQLRSTVEALVHERAPSDAPEDPGQRQDFLRAVAFLRLVGLRPTGERSTSSRPATGGRPEMVVVIDASPDEHGVARVDWGLPIELPAAAIERVLRQARVRAVTIRDGTIVHAPGRLDLGRERRLASHDQRTALRALYATCAIPGCAVRYDHTKLHHVTWWEHGGPTDLHNLLPVCERHHQTIHKRGWKLHLAADRSVTITLPDRSSVAGGRPGRAA